MKVRGFVAVAAAVVSVGAFAIPASAAGGKPAIERWVDVYTLEHDDLYLDLCGIDTTTRATERWEIKTFPDGSQNVHVVRTYVSVDPRLPIEKGAAKAFYDAAGNRTVVGTPIHLIGPRGTTVIDAGRISLDAAENILDAHGQHPLAPGADLAKYYCP